MVYRTIMYGFDETEPRALSAVCADRGEQDKQTGKACTAPSK